MTYTILLIDDVPNTLVTVEKYLTSIGIKGNIKMCVTLPPDEDGFPFGNTFPSVEELDTLDFALVDLELGLANEVNYDRGELDGGTLVLPRLRREAPWLPAIALSRLFGLGQASKHFVSIAGSFGFDGQISKASLVLGKNSSMPQYLFQDVLEGACEVRLQACMAEPPDLTRGVDVSIPPHDESLMNDIGDNWRDLIQRAFWFAERVVVQSWRPGYSGSAILRAYGIARDTREESQWLLKINSSPSKLQSEARAHRRMREKGVTHAMRVPLLWPNVIVHERLALLGYQFATDYVPFSEFVDRGIANLGSRLKLLRKALSSFYARGKSERMILRHSLTSHLVAKHNYEDGMSALPECDASRILSALLSVGDCPELDTAIEVTTCLIHGDLHCDNIMMSDKDVALVDFARGRIGSVAYDASKLLSDIIIRMVEFNRLVNIDDVCHDLMDKLLKAFNMPSNEVNLVRLFIVFHMVRAISYPQLSSETKAKLLDHVSILALFEWIKGLE